MCGLIGGLVGGCLCSSVGGASRIGCSLGLRCSFGGRVRLRLGGLIGGVGGSLGGGIGLRCGGSPGRIALRLVRLGLCGGIAGTLGGGSGLLARAIRVGLGVCGGGGGLALLGGGGDGDLLRIGRGGSLRRDLYGLHRRGRRFGRDPRRACNLEDVRGVRPPMLPLTSPPVVAASETGAS